MGGCTVPSQLLPYGAFVTVIVPGLAAALTLSPACCNMPLEFAWTDHAEVSHSPDAICDKVLYTFIELM